MLLHEELTAKIIGVFYETYNELGHGFREIHYHRAMLIALQDAGLAAAREVPAPVYFRGHCIGEQFLDLVAADLVILELKACRAIIPDHEAQVMGYLRATYYEVGLILNLGPKPEFKRIVFENSRKRLPPR